MAGSVHGSCVAVGEAGILIRGPSGSGKSTLALALVEAARRQGRFARLVADDRVVLAAIHGRLVARPHRAIAGLVEERGVGIGPAPFLDAAVVRLVVDLEAEPARLPKAGEAEVAGLVLPLCVLPARAGAPEAVLRRLYAVGIDPVAASPRTWHSRGSC